MDYKPLAKMFHESSSPNRFSDVETVAKARLEAESSFKIGIETEYGELFLASPRELSVLSEKVLRLERRVSSSMRGLPPIARASLVRSLVMDEVVWTNDLEGIHSTRRQIGELLVAIEDKSEAGPRDRFLELTKLYMGLSDAEGAQPSKPEDIRKIYDRIMLGELADKDMPDGRLFRAQGVDIIGSGERVLHKGLEPERRIIEALEKMLAFASSENVPRLYSAIASHYIFEHAHPFYDGNGRTGRYLLALYLSEPLSLLTSLSLSRTIAENRDAYYRAFNEAQDPLNHGELTFFVMDIMELVRKAQSMILDDLEKKGDALESANGTLYSMAQKHGLDEKDANIIFMLVQIGLFGAPESATLEEIANHIGLGTQMTRKRLVGLEDEGLVEVVKKRPLRFTLSKQAESAFGIKAEE